MVLLPGCVLIHSLQNLVLGFLVLWKVIILKTKGSMIFARSGETFFGAGLAGKGVTTMPELHRLIGLGR